MRYGQEAEIAEWPEAEAADRKVRRIILHRQYPEADHAGICDL